MYLVTKHFVSGLLAGLHITEQTRVRYVVGVLYTPCAGSSSYVVTGIEEVPT
jgi:hypothetical protein